MKRFSLHSPIWIHVIAFCIFSHVHCASPPFSGNLPWLTGPLLTPSARLIPKGHVNVEPYLIWREVNGRYNNHGNDFSIPAVNHLTCQLPIKVGIANNVDLSILIQNHNIWRKNASSTGFGDSFLGLSYQLMSDKNNRAPVKVYIQEIFPTGKYEKLKPSKLGTDARGLGSYITVAGAVIGKLFFFGGEHYLNTRFDVATAFPTQVKVKGISSFGGDIYTNGKVFPGKSLNLLCSGEYSLTRHWVLAMDLTAFFSSKTKFKGHTFTPIRSHSASQFTATPSIEYNFTKTIGLIVGAWFTFAGKNADRFIGAAAALNCYF